MVFVEVVCLPQLTLRKIIVFVMETYSEDVKQDEKHVPDLLEAMMRPTFFVKEALRQNLFRISQLRSKITTIRV